ncbi:MULTISPECIES: NmrA family NAD(P)-binding protein [unclassified Duganella]|uniref:NmrA family NAD(P)-binding protein n=1 Tax=unclassified Duganella TaxID=2636909 RepID=UPI000E351160|nr:MULTISPECIES: NmrA family NAD(P)-binding protein [unclassified Duganella]RFP16074.1 NAD-dependent epimerase/dehydratase family protein [Duganella sp. BJB475]RFP32762.1 NAD-dependent epimerase/dehydratase family protein [Duganella sp. BJB476]
MTTSFPLPYVVFGVTGRTGAAAADALLRAGQPVRVVVRDPAQGRPWAERGAEVAVADLTDLASMVKALSQVQGAYVVSPQHYHREDLFERAGVIADITARAALAAGVPRLVALSSVGADRESGTGWIGMNRMFEQRLGATGVPTTFLRAAYFMENWMPLVGFAVRSGTLPTFLAPPQRPIPMVATVDVGAAAAALLQEARKGSGVVTLSGPRDYAPNDVAAIISAALRKPVEVAALPETEWANALADADFSRAALAGFTEMTRGLNGPHIDIKNDAAAIEWAGTTTLEQVIVELVQRQR